jgi:hypothetical protein
MVSEEKLVDTKVLITTCVLDNGVNFRDIRNVVISDISKTKCLQMVGRARVEKGSRVTLYIKRLNEKDVAYWIQQLEWQRSFYHDYETSNNGTDEWFQKKYLTSEHIERVNQLLGIQEANTSRLNPKPSRFPNEIAQSLAVTLLTTYKNIRSEMQRDTTNKLPGQKYLEYQLSWFGQKYRLGNDITLKDKDEGTKALVEFLESYAVGGSHMFKEGQDKFRHEFTALYDRVYPRRDKNKNRSPYGLSTINNALEEHGFGFKIKSERNRSEGSGTFWVVVKI